MNIGDKMPDLLGYDQDGTPVRLTDYKGRKIVLFTYSKDNTSGCTSEALAFKQLYDDFVEWGCQIIGVSKDTAASHKKFIEKHDLPFPLIADTDTTLLQTLGVWKEKNMYGKKVFGTVRTTFLIDENGYISRIITPKGIKAYEHAWIMSAYANPTPCCEPF